MNIDQLESAKNLMAVHLADLKVTRASYSNTLFGMGYIVTDMGGFVMGKSGDKYRLINPKSGMAGVFMYKKADADEQRAHWQPAYGSVELRTVHVITWLDQQIAMFTMICEKLAA